MATTTLRVPSRRTSAVLGRRISTLEEALLKKERSEAALKVSEKRYRRLFESAKDGILILDAVTGRVVDVNPFLLHLLGYSFESMFGKYLWDLGAFRDIAASKDAFRTLQDNDYIRYEDLPLETLDGRLVAVEFVSNVYLVDRTRVIQCNIRDITARKHAEAERRQLMAAIEQVRDTIVMTDAKGDIEYVNPAFEKTTGHTRDEAVGQNARMLKSGKQDEALYRGLWDVLAGGGTWSGVLINRRKDGGFYTVESSISPVRDPKGRIVNYVAVSRDISEQLRMRAQFQQAQKMEAVGLLAGGVAHDYNNMLSVILGYTELALGKTDPAESVHADLDEVHKAAMRSTEITRQLLAFARKQTIIPVVLDLNRNVESMLKMLRRLIGENIDLVWRPLAGLHAVKMDPVQVDQVLANLCINAKDAISDVGQVTIETGNVVFDEAFCADHDGFVPGEYVMLAVGDNGCGMTKATLDQIFQPFFTSKGVGQGTGLGLSTVYGIVKQNDGFVDVDSEPGKGSTFRIYFRRHPGDAVDVRLQPEMEIPSSGGETLLVVEDEPLLLAMAQTMLERMGYRVTSAGSPAEAIRQVGETGSGIDLMITDVMMPGMNGRDLVDRVHAIRPGMKILYMSGYTASVVGHRGKLDGSVNFIQKPFSLKELSVGVRHALKSPPGNTD